MPGSFLLQRSFLLLASGLAVAILASCHAPSDRGERGVWRFAIEETQGSVQDAYAQRFKQLIEERSDGEVRVIVYPYGALGTSDHILEQLHNGTLDFAMASPGHLGKLIPEMQLFLLHFALSEDEDINACALSDPELREAIEGLYREKGLRFVDVFSEGFMVWTTRRAVRSPEDFAGMKFRVMTSPLLIALYSAYGASPTPLPYSEVYSGLQLRMIDGQANPVFAIQEMSFYEVTDYLIFPRAAPFVSTVAGSPAFFESLSPERRTLVETTLSDLHLEIDAIQQSYNKERLDRILSRKPGMKMLELSDAERQRFREASAPVRQTYAELAGPRGVDLLGIVEAAVRRAPARCGL